VLVDDALIALTGLRCEVSLRIEPQVSPRADCDLGAGRINILTGQLRVLDAGEVALSVDLASERLVALLAAWVAVPRHVAKPAAILSALDTGHEPFLSARFRARYALTRAAVAHCGVQ
jgi:hypothetical protein